MATKPTPRSFKRWDTYVAEAEQPPFELVVSDDHTIVVPAPTGEQVFEAQRAAASGDAEQMLRIACGPAADDVIDLVKGAPYKAMQALSEDLMRHFGFAVEQTPGESAASSS